LSSEKVPQLTLQLKLQVSKTMCLCRSFGFQENVQDLQVKY
jgi:hypothetical protein